MTKNFEEFPVYQKSLDLVESVYMFLNDPIFNKEFEFVNQLKRAAISIANNIAEGSEDNNNRQFIRFLKISKGSCAEVRNLILINERLKFKTDETSKRIKNLSIEISANLSNFIKYLSNNIERKNFLNASSFNI